MRRKRFQRRSSSSTSTASVDELSVGQSKSGTAATYAGFISYSRAVDGKLAPALQGALHRFAKPWYRLRAIRVFRDDASLAANPSLWSSIKEALDGSEFFILLASPESAESKWVEKELSYWIKKKAIGNVLVALTGGEAWDAEDFDWATTTALPPSLRGRFAEEPRYTDLRWARSEEHLSSADGRFRDSVADLAAPLHHQAKDQLVGEDVRQHRRTIRFTRAAITILTVLLAVATSAAIVAIQQRRTALAQRDLATSRQLAAQAELKAGTDLQAAMLLSIEAFKISDNPETRASLAQRLQRNQHVERFLSGPGTPVRNVTFSPDGQVLASANGDNEVSLWNVAPNGQRVVLQGNDRMTAPSFSPDGRILAASEGDGLQRGTVALWDVALRKRIATLADDTGYIGTPVFSPDGRILATSGLDRTTHSYPTGKVILWDVATHRQMGVLSGDNPMDRIRFSPDGRIIAVADGLDISLWDVARRSRLGTLTSGHGRGVLDLSFSPDGQTLASGGHDARLVLWDVAKRTQLAAWTRNGDVSAVAFSPDGRVLAAGDDSATIGLWDVAQRTLLHNLAGGHTSAVFDISFSPDGRRIASGGNDGRIILWNKGQLNPLVLATLPHAIDDLSPGHTAFSPDATILAASTGPDVVLWDIPRRAPLATLPGAGGRPSFSRDGRILATATSTDVLLWDVTKQTRLASLTGGVAVGSYTPGPVLSPDGRILATVVGGNVVLWDVTQRNKLATLEGDDVRGLAFSPDGRTLATGSVGYTEIVLWDVTQGTRLRSFSSYSGDPVSSLSFSPDGSQLAWSALESANTAIGGDYSIILWDIANNTKRTSFTVHTGLARTVAFSPDGSALAWDGDNVVLWSIELGGPMATMTDPGSRNTVFLYNPVFSPDGRMLATDSSDNSIVLWDVDVQSWVRRACSIAGRDLTQAEWAASLPDLPYQSTCTS
ncbi:MAG: LpqB family beta-propeller domain-containing protein [Pseudonocardiaceae bacterium]